VGYIEAKLVNLVIIFITAGGGATFFGEQVYFSEKNSKNDYF
jgi:hypothetical protein